MDEQTSELRALGDLPEWDLSDLYPGITSRELSDDLSRAATAAKGFAGTFKNRVDGLDGDALAQAIARYEILQELLGRIGSFASLTYAGNVGDPDIGAFFQDTQERLNLIETDLLFFTLEINLIEDGRLEALYSKSAALERYSPWIRDIRVFRPYQLSDELERLFHEKDVSGRAAWVRLFDQTMTGLRFEVGAQSLSSEQALHLLSDRDPEVRRQACHRAQPGVRREYPPLCVGHEYPRQG